MDTYEIVRFYQRGFPSKVLRRHVSLEEAQEHCSNPLTSSRTASTPEAQSHTCQFGPWFDGYRKED